MPEDLLELRQRLDQLQGAKMALEKQLIERNSELVMRITNVGMEIKALQELIKKQGENDGRGEESEISS